MVMTECVVRLNNKLDHGCYWHAFTIYLSVISIIYADRSGCAV
jgi:hypothetical protein